MTLDSDSGKEEEEKLEKIEPPGEISISLCGGKLSGEEDDIMPVFKKYQVPFKVFSDDPIALINHPDLMIKIGENLYDWKMACPIMFSMLVYKQDLPEETMTKLVKKQMKKSSWKTFFSSLRRSNKPEVNRDSIREKPEEGAPEASASDSDNFSRTAVPTSEMLESMKLKIGKNEITYIVKSKLRGE